MNESTLIQPLREFRIEPEFVGEVLKPYRPNCRYLKSAKAVFEGEPSWETLTTEGEFGIGESCYIDDTGHFNAVEFNICYNQLAYVHLAYCVRHRILPALDSYDEPGFFRNQLANFLIARLESRFQSQMNPRRFFGSVRVVSARKGSKLSILKTACRFHDESGGRSDGEVKLAVLNP